MIVVKQEEVLTFNKTSLGRKATDFSTFSNLSFKPLVSAYLPTHRVRKANIALRIVLIELKIET